MANVTINQLPDFGDYSVQEEDELIVYDQERIIPSDDPEAAATTVPATTRKITVQNFLGGINSTLSTLQQNVGNRPTGVADTVTLWDKANDIDTIANTVDTIASTVDSINTFLTNSIMKNTPFLYDKKTEANSNFRLQIQQETGNIIVSQKVNNQWQNIVYTDQLVRANGTWLGYFPFVKRKTFSGSAGTKNNELSTGLSFTTTINGVSYKNIIIGYESNNSQISFIFGNGTNGEYLAYPMRNNPSGSTPAPQPYASTSSVSGAVYYMIWMH